MKKEMVGDVPGNVLGMLADLALKLKHGSLSPEELEMFLQRKNPFADPSAPLADWQDFYRTEFGITLDTASIRVPERRRGFDRLIVVPQGITIQQVYDRCSGLFHCWKYTSDNLDKAIPTNDRTPANGSYAVWLRDRIEADEELKNLSANDLKQRNIPGITLLERLLYELKYFRETGKHLDVRSWTLCSGSRHADGFVPCVHWHPGCRRLWVGWYGPGLAFVDIRAREVVS